jgi:aspartyl-tRNA(Asn)/glutamyl-tRNA(Gln) amidotransferase subunit C
MALNRTDVEKIAHLARLSLNEDQMESYATDLSRILGLVEELESADTDEISPMAHPLHMTQRLRADGVTEENHRDAYQAVAPKVVNGLFLVPRVIE